MLIPFLASLLRSVELYASSICTIVETMNLTVEANVVEPRAGMSQDLKIISVHGTNICWLLVLFSKSPALPSLSIAWNVLLCHVAEYAMKSGHSGMIRVMCEFYSIVAFRNEGLSPCFHWHLYTYITHGRVGTLTTPHISYRHTGLP